MLTGGAGPFNLDDAGAGRTSDTDCQRRGTRAVTSLMRPTSAADSGAATAAEVAAVLNREYPGDSVFCRPRRQSAAGTLGPPRHWRDTGDRRIGRC